MVRKVVVVTAAVILVAICALGSFFAYEYADGWLRERRSPYNQPGTAWTDSVLPLGYGTDLILLENGTYAARAVCDICPQDDFAKGTWSHDSGTITLVPAAHPEKRYTLIKENRSGCAFLRDQTPARKRHPIFASRSSKRCIEVLANELRAGYEKRESPEPGTGP